MIKRTPITVALLITLLILSSACATRGPQLNEINEINEPPTYSATIKQAPTVPFCELIRDSARYDNGIVSTQAIFFRNMENAYLYDPSCESDDTYVWTEFDPSYVYTDDTLKKKLDELLCPNQPCPMGRAHVTVVGRIEGPSRGPYGHLDGYRFRFSLIRLQQAETAQVFNH